MKSISSLIKVTSILVLSGCANSPYLQEKSRYRQALPTVQLSEQEQIETSYLARLMLGTDDRAAWSKKAGALARKQSELSTAAGMATGADMVTNLAMGDANSPVGAMIGSAVFVGATAASLLLDRWDIDQTSQAFFGEEWKGQQLMTAADATGALYRTMDHKVKTAAQKVGMSAECIKSCDGSPRMYHLTKLSGSTSSYPYEPETGIYLMGHWGRMIKADDDPIRDRSLGFKPKWMTGYGHTLQVLLGGKARLERDGKPYMRLRPNGEVVESLLEDMAGTEIGMEIYRSIFSEEFPAFYFDNDIHPNYGFYRGQVYTWVLENNRRFINSKLIFDQVKLKSLTQSDESSYEG